MTRSRTRHLAIIVAVAVASLTLAACGSSSSASSSQSSTAAASAAPGGAFNRTQFRACLKAHGVTLPARPPGPGAGGAPGSGGSQSGSARPRRGFLFGAGGAAASPKVRAALQACGAGRFPRRRVALSHAAVLRFVACVRSHGYKLPTPNFSGSGSIFPPSIAGNPRFRTAASACGSLLRPPGAPGTGAAPQSTGTTATSGA